MRLNPGTRARVSVDLLANFDPTGSTVEVQVDNVWYPADWQGSPVVVTVSPPRWFQSAQTSGYFAGPTVAAAGAVVLTAGRHNTAGRVTHDGTIVPVATAPIDVG